MKEDVDPKCRVRGKTVESFEHMKSGCAGLAQREYLKRHDRSGGFEDAPDALSQVWCEVC